MKIKKVKQILYNEELAGKANKFFYQHLVNLIKRCQKKKKPLRIIIEELEEIPDK